MQDRIEAIEQELAVIRERNARVEADKAWETGPVRVVSVMIVTYMIASIVLTTIGNDAPMRNALIPTLGYYLSTRSLRIVRAVWSKVQLCSDLKRI